MVRRNQNIESNPIEEDYLDYNAAAETKRTNKRWTDHDKLKEKLGIS